MSANPKQWAIISPGDGRGFIVVPVIDDDGQIVTYETEPNCLRVARLADLYVVARHTTQSAALDGLIRAQNAEKLMRPIWQASVEHEIRCRRMMQDAVAKAAKAAQ
jgi:hypothetical protein